MLSAHSPPLLAPKQDWRIQLEDLVVSCRDGLEAAKQRHSKLLQDLSAEEVLLADLQERLDQAEEMLLDVRYLIKSTPAVAIPDGLHSNVEEFNSVLKSPNPTPPDENGPLSPESEREKFRFREDEVSQAPVKRSILHNTANQPAKESINPSDQRTSSDSDRTPEPTAITKGDSSASHRFNSLNVPRSREPPPIAPPSRSIRRSHTLPHLATTTSRGRDGFDEIPESLNSPVTLSQSHRDLKAPLTRTVSTMSSTSEMSQISASHSILERLTGVVTEVEYGLLGKLPSYMRMTGDPVVVFRMVDGETVWHICKAYTQLLKFANLLTPFCKSLGLVLPPFPDRALFTNQTPANVDQRNDMLTAFISEFRKIASAEAQTGLTLPLKHKQMVGSFMLSDVVDLSNTKNLKGYLLRKGRFGSWKLRYYVVNGSFMDVYDKVENAPVESIRIRGATVRFVEPPSIGNSEERNAFEIIDTHKKRLLFCADTPEIRQKWVHTLADLANAPLERPSVLPTPLLFTRSNTLPPSLRPARPHNDFRRGMNTDSSMVFTEWDDAEDESAQRNLPDPKGYPQQNGSTWRSSSGKYDGPGPRRVFGATLESTMKVATLKYHGCELPAILVRCLEILNTNEALTEEGLFRITGSQSKLDKLEATFEKKGDFDLKAACDDVHVTATLLKRYLRSLPDSFLPDADETGLRGFAALDGPARVAFLAETVQRMPSLQYNVLASVVALLVKVTKHQGSNKMSSRNVSIVLSPSLNVPSDVTLIWIENFSAIFDTRR